MIIDLKTAE